MKDKTFKFLSIIALVFGSLFFAIPAQATTIQFTYYWTSYEYTYTDTTINVTVINDITNKIGGNGEVIDTYRITIGDQIIERTEKHGPLTYSFNIVGTQTIKLEGIDWGFWAGYYGPIMQIEVVNPEVLQTETESPTASPEPTQSSTVSSDVTDSPTISQDVSSSSSVSPQPEPVQEIPIYIEPVPITPQEPEQEVAVEPQPEEPTVPPKEEPASESETSSMPIEEPKEDEPESLPEPESTSAPEEPSDGIVEETDKDIIIESVTPEEPVLAVQENHTEVPAEIVAIPLIGDIAVAVFEAFDDLSNVGADMTPEARERSEDVVVASVIVGQIAQTASMAASSAASATTRRVK